VYGTKRALPQNFVIRGPVLFSWKLSARAVAFYSTFRAFAVIRAREKNMLDRKVLGPIGLLTGIGALLPGVIGTADASTIVQSKTFMVTATPAEPTDPGEPSESADKSTTVQFDQFDPSLGTLTEIDLSLSSTLSASLSVSGSTAEQMPNSTATWDGTVTLTTPDGVDFSDTQSFSISCGFGSCSNSSTSSFTEIGSKSLTGPFAPGFFGTGMFDALYDLDLTVSVVNNAGGTPPSSAFGSGTWDPPPPKGLTVTYIYTPNATVPEPGTLALLGMGAMAGLGFSRRRPKKDG
jgi:hypothetical protein